MDRLRRIALRVAYDGTAYAGWQRQINAVAVQQVLEEALEALTGASTAVTGASRTDAGVHALGQVAHFDTLSRIPAEKFAFALNTHLPHDIRVVGSRAGAPAFHARFGATGKRYRYQIHNHRHAPALERNFRWHVPLTLDLDRMRSEARTMLGTHDFAAFAASGSCAKDTVRTVTALSIEQADELVTLFVEGNGFLYNMVRILAGTLADVGCGRIPEGAIARALESKDRLALGQTAPAQGLTLLRVWYPDNAF